MSYTNWEDPAAECALLSRVHSLSDRKNTLVESFNWLSQDFKIQKTTPKSIIVKVKAAHGNTVSKNGRRYLTEELLKAARTATGKKVDLNHNSQQIGKVHLADYEDDDLEMVVEIWKEPYVELLRNKSMDVKGWSVSASYLFNECSKCHKRFNDNDSYLKHMRDEEFILSAETMPRGIVFGEYAISLVTSPETPGLETSHELMETAKGFNALCETFLTEHGYNAEESTSETAVEPKTLTPLEYAREILKEPNIKKNWNKFTDTKEIEELDQHLLSTSPEPYRTEYNAVMAVGDAVVIHCMERVKEVESGKAIKEVENENTRLKETVGKQTLELEQHAKNLAETLKLAESFKTEAERLKPFETEAVKITETVNQQKQALEEIKKTADSLKTENDRLKPFEALAETVTQQKQQLAEATTKIQDLTAEVTRRDGLVEANRKLKIENDNLKDKMQGSYKGHAPSTLRKNDLPLTHDPTTGRQRQ